MESEGENTPSVLDLYSTLLASKIEAALPRGVHYVLLLFRPAGDTIHCQVVGDGASSDQVLALEAALTFLGPPDA